MQYKIDYFKCIIIQRLLLILWMRQSVPAFKALKRNSKKLCGAAWIPSNFKYFNTWIIVFKLCYIYYCFNLLISFQIIHRLNCMHIMISTSYLTTKLLHRCRVLDYPKSIISHFSDIHLELHFIQKNNGTLLVLWNFVIILPYFNCTDLPNKTLVFIEFNCRELNLEGRISKNGIESPQWYIQSVSLYIIATIVNCVLGETQTILALVMYKIDVEHSSGQYRLFMRHTWQTGQLTSSHWL